MADQLQLRGGTTTEHSTFTGALREVTVDTDKDTLIVHDAATAGGHPLLREDGSNSALSLGTAGTPSIKFTGDTNTGIYSPGADQVAISTGGTGRLFVDSDGDIGIGTTSPSQSWTGGSARTQQLSGASGQITVFRINEPGATYGDLQLISTGSAETAIYNFANGAMRFGTSGTERLRIDSSGRVGIGTSSPTTSAGGVDISSGGIGLVIGADGSVSTRTNSTDKIFRIGSAHYTNAEEPICIAFGQNLSSDNELNFGGGTAALNAATYIRFFTAANNTTTSGTERMRIDSSGRVGVGTTSPTETLTLNAAAGASLGFEYGGTEIATISNNNAALYVHAQSGKLLSLGADGSEKMRIDSSGRVGVGTSSPDATLHISKSLTDGDTLLRIQPTSFSAGYSVRQAFTRGSTDLVRFTVTSDAGNADKGSLLISTSSTTSTTNPVAAFTGDGRVGVGTTSPAAKLDVRGNSTGDAKIRLDENGSFQAALQLRGNDLEIRGSSGTIEFYRGNNNEASSTELARFDSSGRFLINTSISKTIIGFNQKTQIEGTSSTSASSAITRNSNDTGGPSLVFSKSRSTSVGGHGQALNSDTLGQILFNGANGTNSDNYSAMIRGRAEAAITTASAPGRLEFHTTAAGSLGPTERMRISEDGTVQITTGGSGYATLFSYSSAGYNFITQGTSADTIFRNTSNSEYARIDYQGRLLVGTSSTESISNVDGKIQVQSTGSDSAVAVKRNSNDAGGPYISLGKSRGTGVNQHTIVQNGDDLGGILFSGADGNDTATLGASIIAKVDGTPGSNDMPGRLVFSTTGDGGSSPAERMYIYNEGNVYISSSSGTYTNLTLKNGPSAANSTDYFQCRDSSNTLKLVIEPDGDVFNTNNTYAAISDVKLKENIVDAGSQWEDIKALRVRNYNFKASTGHGTHKQIGVIAQELELVSPGLVQESIDTGDGPDGEHEVDLGTTTKSVNYSVLYMKAVKALQEAMERIETLEANNVSLEARLAALETN